MRHLVSMISPASIPPLVGALCNAGLGCFVLSRGPDKATHKSFAAFSISVFLWNIAAFVLFQEMSYAIALNFSKLIFVAVIALSPCYLHFICALLNLTPKYAVKLWIADVMGIALIILTIFGPVVVDIRRVGYCFFGIGGSIFPIIPVYIMTVIWSSLLVGLHELPKLQGHNRTQLQYFMVALFTATLGGLNDFLPLIGIDK